MHAVRVDDPRGVSLCVDWLRDGTSSEAQSSAIRSALAALTGESFPTDQMWIQWYDGGLLSQGSKNIYPEPDFTAWFQELKRDYTDNEENAAAQT